jgi:hypothetical protein
MVNGELWVVGGAENGVKKMNIERPTSNVEWE